MVMVRFEPVGKKVFVNPGVTVFEAAEKVGVKITSECGRTGSCGKCRVIVEDQSSLSEISESELQHIKPAEFRLGYRLACCADVKGDVVVLVPPESRVGVRRIQVKGMERPVKLNPAVEKVHLALSEPAIDDIVPDVERVLDSLREAGFGELEINYELLKTLPDVLRRENWDVTAAIWNGQWIISIEGGDTENSVYGVSVDIGTSKIVGYLVDLTSGDVVAIKSLENPQLAYGEDVLSRIRYTMSGREALKKLQEIVVEAINTVVSEACREAGINSDEVYEFTVAGNTAMHHLLLGIQAKYLTLAPYVPAIKRPVNVRASSLGIKANPRGNVHVLPVIAGFVGADAVADLLATGIYEAPGMHLLMDVGTNGEVFVGNRADIVSCSCAAGPAFEGMHIKHGMKAAEGAIERLKIDPDTWEVEYETIGGGRPLGICGSGMVDAVAEMFECGIIDQRGAFSNEARTPRLRWVGGEPEFVVVWKRESGMDGDITVDRKDIQEIQLAKAAMHTGAAVLMGEMGVTEKDLDRVYIAGAFGEYISPESARFVGLIPDVPTEKIGFVGNTAISGAKMALVSREIRETAQRLSRKVRYVELMTHPDFRREFFDSMFLPHRDLNMYPMVADYFRARNMDLKG